MKQHHYMKYLFVLFLFLPTSLMAQNKEEKMPGHITKIQKLEDVNVTGNRPTATSCSSVFGSAPFPSPMIPSQLSLT